MSEPAPHSPFRVIGVMKNATEEEADAAYAAAYKAARRGQGAYTPEEVNAAREALQDPDARAMWEAITYSVPIQPELIQALLDFRGPYSQAGLRLELEPEDLLPYLPALPDVSDQAFAALCARETPVPDDAAYLEATKRVVLETLDPWAQDGRS